MLDSLGSTLSRTTVNSFFTRHNKKPLEDELSMSEAVQCLETELGRPTSEKRRLSDHSDDGSQHGTSVSTTPVLVGTESTQGLALGQLDFSGPPAHRGDADVEHAHKLAPPPTYSTEPGQQLLLDAAVGIRQSELAAAHHHLLHVERQMSESSSSDVDDPSGLDSGTGNGEDVVERVINVKNCPLCHRPRLNSKAEVDIVTHLAVCASHDWAKVDKIVVGNFVTASQAQRKWYTKVISKVSSGDYKLGAVSLFRFSSLRRCFLNGGDRTLPISSYRIGSRDNWRKRKCRCMLDWVFDYYIRYGIGYWRTFLH
jgi:phosphatidylserine decarboxylase